MTKRLEIYRCEICGNMVEMLHPGKGELVCCGQPMKLCPENTAGAAQSEHAPVIEKLAGSFKISVGSIPHPMEGKHYIEWIEAVADDKAYRQFLGPGDLPEATFTTSTEQITARHYCNIHGLWKG